MAEFEQLGVAADHVTRNPAMRQEVLNVHPNAKFHDIKHRLNEDELIEVLIRGLSTASVVEPEEFLWGVIQRGALCPGTQGRMTRRFDFAKARQNQLAGRTAR